MLLVAGVLTASVAYVYATTVIGQLAGNAADSNATTFKFQSDNSDKALTRPNLAPIARSEVPSLYGTANGMTVYDNGVDVTSAGYTGLGGAKTPVGVDLSDAAGWPNVATGRNALGIDPSNGRFKFFENAPYVIGTGAAGTATRVAFYSGYIYVASGTDGVRIFDATNPGSPVQVNHIATTNAQDVFINGLLSSFSTSPMAAPGCVATGSLTLASPSLLSTYDTIDAKGVYANGNLVYIADGNAGFKVVNFATPSSPSAVSGLATTDARSCRSCQYGLSGRRRRRFQDHRYQQSQHALVQRHAGYHQCLRCCRQRPIRLPGRRRGGLRIYDVANVSAPQPARTVRDAQRPGRLDLAAPPTSPMAAMACASSTCPMRAPRRRCTRSG